MLAEDAKERGVTSGIQYSSFNKYLCSAKDLQGRGLRVKKANDNAELKLHQPKTRVTASYTAEYKPNVSQELVVFSELVHVTRESWSLLLKGLGPHGEIRPINMRPQKC